MNAIRSFGGTNSGNLRRSRRPMTSFEHQQMEWGCWIWDDDISALIALWSMSSLMVSTVKRVRRKNHAKWRILATEVWVTEEEFNEIKLYWKKAIECIIFSKFLTQVLSTVTFHHLKFSYMFWGIVCILLLISLK